MHITGQCTLRDTPTRALWWHVSILVYMLIKNNISIISTFSSGLSSSIYVSLNVHRLFFRDGGGWPQISAKRKLLVDQTIFAGQHIRYGHRNRPRTPPSANLSPKRFRPRVVSLNVHLLISIAKFTRDYWCKVVGGLYSEQATRVGAEIVLGG